jgi:hypothetical protein
MLIYFSIAKNVFKSSVPNEHNPVKEAACQIRSGSILLQIIGGAGQDHLISSYSWVSETTMPAVTSDHFDTATAKDNGVCGVMKCWS